MDDPVRTYGGWRRSRNMGLLGLGPMQTLLVLGAITMVIVAASVSLRALAVSLAPALLLIGANLLRWDGVPVMHSLRERTRWAVGSARGHTVYRSGAMADGEHAWQLPGVLAPTTLLSVSDPVGGDFGLVHHQRLGTMTVTLRGTAHSTWLADRAEADTWVAQWGGWLAGLGLLPMVCWVSVTVDTAPDPGSRLADEVARRQVPNAPAAARRVLRQLVQASPAAAADVETRVSITFAPAASPARPRDLAEAVAEVSRALAGLQDGLGQCGLSSVRRATALELVAIVRAAYDPPVRGDLARLTPDLAHQLLDWGSAGPVFAEEARGHYRHDGAVSVSWSWHEAPRQQVHADVLARLLSPGHHPKRVSLLYRPMPAGEAARIVEREVNAAAFRTAYRRAQKRDESARDLADRERALRNARDEAVGAGVGLLSLFVTVTVADEAELGRAVADIEARADAAKIRLRRMWSSQAAGFAITLPCGICPPVLAQRWPR
ncbi:MAG TPA: SCO6880 family protein [Micromonosporaceae bacterium]